jgi:methyltransferase (TIGR00027 family)
MTDNVAPQPDETVHKPRAASQSALTAAAARAAHFIVDQQPWIFVDTLAEPLLGSMAPELLAYHHRHGDHLVLAGARAQVVVRSHVTERVLRSAQARGTTQYVILGAGLDSYAYRETAPGTTVFEVDHPLSQQDKRDRVAAAGLQPRTPVAYVPVDLETEPLLPALIAAGFAADRPALVSWLGVSMYLSGSAVGATLAELAKLPAGTEVVFDYMLGESDRDEAGQAYVDMVAPHNDERGEPWLSFFGPDAMTELLRDAGFGDVRHYRQSDAVPPRFWARSDSLRPARLSMIAHAQHRPAHRLATSWRTR